MRKTILVIGAAIGLAASVASVVHASDIIDVEIEHVTAAVIVDEVKADLDIKPTITPEFERITHLAAVAHAKCDSFIDVALSDHESTKLESDKFSLNQQRTPGEYRQRYEVGWRF